MFDVALIQQCADPGIEIAIVERFIAEAGSDNPLKVTITSGNRVILPEPPKTQEAAVRLMQRFVGEATVRVGVTQFPVGYGLSDAAQITTNYVDPCENIRMGTALFGKVYRIVSHASGGNGGPVLGEAIDAWRTGTFRDDYVFGLPDPGPLAEELQEEAAQPAELETPETVDAQQQDDANTPVPPALESADPNTAGIRIDLSNLKGDSSAAVVPKQQEN